MTDEFVARTRPDMLQDKEIPPFVAVFRVTGPLLFGSTDKLDVVRDRLDGLPPIVVLRLRYMTAIDATGLAPSKISRTWCGRRAGCSSCRARASSRSR